jgi:phosphatidate cytidylyltransferase
MKQRIVTALCGLPLLIICIWVETPWFYPLTILIAIAALWAGIEFFRLSSFANGKPLATFGIVWILLCVLNAHFESSYTFILLPTAIALPAIGALLFRRGNVITSWSWTVAGILYIGWLISYYVLLRGAPHGREWTIIAFFSTFGCDTAAFLVGRIWGKHHFMPDISPAKTREGAIGGFLGAIASALILGMIFDFTVGAPASYPKIAFTGCLIGIFAQLGDLVESLLKRTAGTKDSGKLLPGHGGILDRMDSILLTGFIAYYCVELM